ncbi:hypothetical protein JQN58_11485 [Aneurinibacillus sp. BA2021]|nr:hypothetical protein [Aneurinibacillus sp. BA2021]
MAYQRKEILLAQMRACHREENWFVTLQDAVDGLTAETAGLRSEEAIGSVWQIVNHLTFWNERYLQRFHDTQPEEVKLTSNDATFTFVDDTGAEQEWQAAGDMEAEGLAGIAFSALPYYNAGCNHWEAVLSRQKSMAATRAAMLLTYFLCILNSRNSSL